MSKPLPNWVGDPASLVTARKRVDQSFRNVIGVSLGAASFMLGIVAVLLNSSALFYMATALVVTIAASRIQSLLSVRGLRIERAAPDTVTAGELVTVHITVWSEHKLRRPLITLRDNLPRNMMVSDVSPSLPIAPAFDIPVQTQYRFRPIKRGKYVWKGVMVEGTDALGLTLSDRRYPTGEAKMTVLPMPLPVQMELPTASGWGISEAQSGQSRGAGIEPRGIREYVSGDALRYVHWASSARMGRLMVKEFEAGSNAAAFFFIQRTVNSEVGVGARTTLEAMCSHCAYLLEGLLRQGARVEFPVYEDRVLTQSPRDRMAEILDLLAGIQADSPASLGQDVIAASPRLPAGSIVFAMAGIADETLLDAARFCTSRGQVLAPLLYNADAFVPKGRRLRSTPASDPGFVDALRQAGARPMIVPQEAYP